MQMGKDLIITDELRKMPSYLPSFRSVQLKPAAKYTQMDAVCREMEEQTGLPCRVAG
ncbi:MAG: hypothetical protein LIO96_01480 [Lachnospiraceae bacterium]|nr:hypothetical protein [Lachnospiraceae bacterium]